MSRKNRQFTMSTPSTPSTQDQTPVTPAVPVTLAVDQIAADLVAQLDKQMTAEVTPAQTPAAPVEVEGPPAPVTPAAVPAPVGTWADWGMDTPAKGSGAGNRYTLIGLSVTAVIRWMGAQGGYTPKKVKEVLARHGLTAVSDSTINCQLVGGRSAAKGDPKRGKVPSLTPEQVKTLLGA